MFNAATGCFEVVHVYVLIFGLIADYPGLCNFCYLVSQKYTHARTYTHTHTHTVRTRSLPEVHDQGPALLALGGVARSSFLWLGMGSYAPRSVNQRIYIRSHANVLCSVISPSTQEVVGPAPEGAKLVATVECFYGCVCSWRAGKRLWWQGSDCLVPEC